MVIVVMQMVLVACMNVIRTQKDRVVQLMGNVEVPRKNAIVQRVFNIKLKVCTICRGMNINIL